MPRPALPALAICLLTLAGCGGRPDAPAVPPPTGERVLVLGLDAATWHVMRPLLDRGELPVLAGLIDRGWSGVLTSMDPTISPALWTTIATGKLPPEHGILGFLATDADGNSVPITSNLRRAETLWTIASRTGRQVNVVGWYVTWPTEPIAGVMVSDRFIPKTQAGLVGGAGSLSERHPGVSPASFRDTAESLMVRPRDFVQTDERAFHEQFNIYPVDATRTAIGEHLLRERPADLTMVYLWGIDPTQHYFWKYHEPEHWPGPPIEATEQGLNHARIEQYYRDTDAFVGRLLAPLGPRDTVIVVSDHGAGPMTTYDPAKMISGDHRLDGIIIAAGPGIRHGSATTPPGLLDVAPTVLHLLGLPVGEDMPGTVISDMFDPAFLARRPIRSIPTWEPAARPVAEHAIPSAADDGIKRKLRSLGYIE